MRHDGAVPAGYQQIADALRAQIRTGRLNPGTRLPGIRALAANHDSTPQTVAAAIRLLAGEGLLVVGHGRATLVADPLPDTQPTVLELAAEVADLRSRVEALEEGRGPDGRG